MEKVKVKEEVKTTINYIQGNTLRDILSTINNYNGSYPESPILKNDIVDIIKEGNTYFLLYYK